MTGPSDPPKAVASPAKRLPVAAAGTGLVVAVALIVTLRTMGRLWWCKCGSLVPWSLDVWSSHNSQHIIDPYLGSHVLHGVVFYAALRLALGVDREVLRWALALGLEAGWEILENTPLIINRYRESTMSLDYFGDSISNSVSDLLACGVGYLVTRRAPPWAAVGLFVGTELAMLATIRDSLLVNVIMLVYPLDAIKHWQTAIAP